MTFADFKNAARRKNSFDRYWNYGVAISVGLFCLFAIYYVTFIDFDKFRAFRYAIYPVLLLLLVMSLSAFRMLPNRYKITEIASGLSLDEKRRVTNSILSEYCEISANTANNFFVSNLKTRWWQSTFTLYFYFDEYKFAFSLQGHDLDGGWLDLGETERKRRKLAAAIQTLIGK